MRQEALPTIEITVSQADRLRCAVLHTHADLQVAVKMLRRLRFMDARRYFKRGYERLGKVVETEKESSQVGSDHKEPIVPGDVRDEGDAAQDYQARHNAAAIAAHREKMAAQMATPSLTICEDCEEEIPEKRRKKQPGCTRCLACQSLHERLKGGM